jgi:hypothetical protein
LEIWVWDDLTRGVMLVDGFHQQLLGELHILKCMLMERMHTRAFIVSNLVRV